MLVVHQAPSRADHEAAAETDARADDDARSFDLDPPFEERECADGYHLRAALAGVRESDVEVTVAGDRLTVFGHRETARRRETARGYLYEHRYASFGRTFTVPARYDAARIAVELRDGALSLVAPARAPTT